MGLGLPPLRKGGGGASPCRHVGPLVVGGEENRASRPVVDEGRVCKTTQPTPRQPRAQGRRGRLRCQSITRPVPKPRCVARLLAAITSKSKNHLVRRAAVAACREQVPTCPTRRREVRSTTCCLAARDAQARGRRGRAGPGLPWLTELVGDHPACEAFRDGVVLAHHCGHVVLVPCKHHAPFNKGGNGGQLEFVSFAARTPHGRRASCVWRSWHKVGQCPPVKCCRPQPKTCVT